ncbi:hypothetical protein M3J09_008905 [Ascochyta lentis]
MVIVVNGINYDTEYDGTEDKPNHFFSFDGLILWDKFYVANMTEFTIFVDRDTLEPMYLGLT